MRRVAFAMILAATAVVACQRNRDEAVERIAEKAIAEHGRDAKVKIDRDHGSITVDLGAAIEPAGWPRAVPFYPRASRAKAKAAGHELSLATDDSTAEVVDFYRRELVNSGWSFERSPEGRWEARRGSERLEVRVSSEGPMRETRAEIRYGSGPPVESPGVNG